MSFNLYPNIIMDSLLKYIDICTMPQSRIQKNTWALFDRYDYIIESIFKTYWYRNMFIELLIEKWIIDSPMLIYSPRRVEYPTTSKMIEEWLYVNKTWHIFYDPILFQSKTKPDFDKIYMSIKLPDLLTYAIISNTVPELCNIVSSFLSCAETCKSSENELIIESDELEKAKLQQDYSLN